MDEKQCIECHSNQIFNITQEVAEVKLEQSELRREIQENNNATKRIEANTAEMLEVFHSFKAAMKVLEWIGKAAKPLGYVAGFCASMYAFWTAVKSGVTPK